MKIQQKRTKPIEKAWYILKPFAVYTVIKTAALLFLAMVIPSLPVNGMAQWTEENSNLLSAVINGAASIVGVAFILKDFLNEVNVTGEIDIDKNVLGQLWCWVKTAPQKAKGKAMQLAAVVSLGITSALALNSFIEIIAVYSQKYDSVEKIQYSVPIWLGTVLYGIVSPFVEEVVFRGVTLNRMKRFFGLPLCVITTAVLFGGFHANLPQFIYGTCMGILMALCYEWVGCFGASWLFHISANVFVFLFSMMQGCTNEVSGIAYCIVFSIISALLVVYLFISSKHSKKQD